MKTLKGIENLDQGLPVCARCGVKIIEENNSGWSAFVKCQDGQLRLQPICILCTDKEDWGEKGN